MVTVTRCVLIACIMFYCDAVTFIEQLDHIAKRRRESLGIYAIPSRRQFDNQMSVILGAPSMPSHLPEAEPILPGHTLIRPARGMLKSAIKFPHMEQDNGAGVYGNVNNLGIRYDGRNERVQYSGFRRMPDSLIVAVPKLRSNDPQYSLASFLELSDKSEEYKGQSMKNLKLKKPRAVNKMIIKIDPPKLFKKRKQKRTHKKKHPKYQASFKHILPQSYSEDMFKKLIPMELSKKRLRLHGPMLRQKHLKSFIDYEPMRRDRKDGEEGKGTPLFVPNGEETSSDYYNTEIESEEKKKEVSKEVKSKLEWFWKSKDAYNNIKINLDAPELSDLMPADVKEKIRQWWFYHQDDFVPFED